MPHKVKDQRLMVTRDGMLRRLAVGSIVSIWITAPYFLLQQFSLYPVFWLQRSWLDQQVPICFPSVYIYLSYFMLLIWASFAVSMSDFVRLMKAICLVTLISHLCFFLFPTGLSRENIPLEQAPALYHFLTDWEKPRNCFPSLHASLTALAVFALWTRNTFSGVVGGVWWLLILWSTLALRQHVVLDLVGGVLLASGIWLLVGKGKAGRENRRDEELV